MELENQTHFSFWYNSNLKHHILRHRTFLKYSQPATFSCIKNLTFHSNKHNMNITCAMSKYHNHIIVHIIHKFTKNNKTTDEKLNLQN